VIKSKMFKRDDEANEDVRAWRITAKSKKKIKNERGREKDKKEIALTVR